MFTDLSPRLHFVDAVDGGEGGGSEVVEPQETVVDAQPEAPKGNPAWDTIRSQLDPISYSKIEPELSKFDQGVQQRITASNDALKPWKGFIDQGVTPDVVQNALSIMQTLDANPAEVYQYLGDFLQRTGRMPTNAEVKEAQATGELDTGTDLATEPNPELEQLREGQEQIRAFLEHQQQVALSQQADQAIEAELSSLKSNHQDLTDADVQEILARAAFVAQQNFAQGKQEVPSLEEIHTGWFLELRNRILSTPRPGDLAPKLLPTAGGGLGNAPKATLGQLTRQQTQDIVAAGLASQNRSG